MSKKQVFLTGGTGVMGLATIKKLLENTDELQLNVLARPSEANKKKLAPYADKIKIIWGDLQDFALLEDSVKGVDYVLHVGAIVSPYAEEKPVEAMLANYGSTRAMLKGIKNHGQIETTRFVYIGTVEMTGDRMPPIHWGRVGDPIKPGYYGYYALSKTASERAVLESGLRYWVSIRQSGMMPLVMDKANYSIISHQPYNNPLEWSNAEDSANLMRNICLGAPDEFWRRAYNLSGGADYRQTCFSFSMDLGGDPRQTYEPKWIATRNFHGHWYTDADQLEALVPFRTKSYKQQIQEQLAEYAEMAMAAGPDFVFPTREQIKAANEAIIHKPGGVLQILEDNDEEGIKVWFGSREQYDAIPESWDDAIIYKPLELPTYLDHGFDESKPKSEINIEDMKQAAKFRGGECLSQSMTKGDLYTPLKWKCCFGHEFSVTPYTVLFAGHWCPEDLTDEWRYHEIAQHSQFFNQVWEPLHKGEEAFRVKMAVDSKIVDEMFDK